MSSRLSCTTSPSSGGAPPTRCAPTPPTCSRYLDAPRRRGRRPRRRCARSTSPAFVVALRARRPTAALAASSTARALAAVRGLHRFAARDGLVADDVARDVAPARAAAAAAAGPSPPTRWRRLLAGCRRGRPGSRCATGRCWSCSTRTGARISEAVGLDVDDLDGEPRTCGCTARAARTASCRWAARAGRRRRLPGAGPPRPGRRGRGGPLCSSTPEARDCRGRAHGMRCGGPPRPPGSRPRCPRTRCGTASPPTSSRAAPTCAWCRSCWATPR